MRCQETGKVLLTKKQHRYFYKPYYDEENPDWYYAKRNNFMIKFLINRHKKLFGLIFIILILWF